METPRTMSGVPRSLPLERVFKAHLPAHLLPATETMQALHSSVRPRADPCLEPHKACPPEFRVYPQDDSWMCFGHGCPETCPMDKITGYAQSSHAPSAGGGQ